MAVFKDESLNAVNDSLTLISLHKGALVKHHITFFLVTWFHKFQGKVGIIFHPPYFENLSKASRTHLVHRFVKSGWVFMPKDIHRFNFFLPRFICQHLYLFLNSTHAARQLNPN